MVKDTNVLVIGLGSTGLSCVRWLIHMGAVVSVADSRAEPPGIATLRASYPDIPVYSWPLPANQLQAYPLIVLSPGVSQREPALLQAAEAGIPVIGDIELFAQHIAHWPSRVIAITGSNGKSTVTSMVGEMAQASGLNGVVAGNIGVPVLDTLLPIVRGEKQPPDFFILELSSFQLETTYSLNPVVATVLNVSEDHIDRYEDMAAYERAKARIFRGNGVMVLNRQDSLGAAMAQPGREARWFGEDAPRAATEYGLRSINGSTALCRGDTALLHANELKVVGRHNAVNALAAIALCEIAGMSLAPILSAVKKFAGLAHRIEEVATVKQVTYYNDSKATNVGAAQAALHGMTQPVVLIAGGQGKSQDFTPLRAACAAHCRLVILLGQDAMQMGAVLDQAVPVLYTTTLEDAVALAATHAKPHDVVLLSPACASLDMFTDYAHRGAVFMQAVHNLEQR